MKPTFQISRRGRQNEPVRSFDRHSSNSPGTDWSFQSDLRGGATPFHPGAKRARLRPAFHTLSQGFFSAEANRESRFEGALFGLIVALAAWPIVLAAQAAAALVK